MKLYNCKETDNAIPRDKWQTAKDGRANVFSFDVPVI